MSWEEAVKEYNEAAKAMLEKIQRSGDMELAEKVDRFTSATLQLIKIKQGDER